MFAANYIWPQHTMTGEQLVLVFHLEPGQSLSDALLQELSRRNAQLLNYKRISGYVRVGSGFSAQRRHENQARDPGGTDRQTTRTRSNGSPVSEAYFTIVNPAAGGGRCGKLAGPALDRLRAAGLDAGSARDARSRRSHGLTPTARTPRDSAISSPWAETAQASRSSTGFSRTPQRTAAPRSAFFRSERAILFFAISLDRDEPSGIRHRGDSCPTRGVVAT